MPIIGRPFLLGGGGGLFKENCAVIRVKAPTNSIVTATKSGVTKTFDILYYLDASNVVYYYQMPQTMFDSSNAWRIQASVNGSSRYKDIIINTPSEYDIILNWVLPQGYTQLEYIAQSTARDIANNTAYAFTPGFSFTNSTETAYPLARLQIRLMPYEDNLGTVSSYPNDRAILGQAGSTYSDASIAIFADPTYTYSNINIERRIEISSFANSTTTVWRLGNAEGMTVNAVHDLDLYTDENKGNVNHVYCDLDSVNKFTGSGMSNSAVLAYFSKEYHIWSGRTWDKNAYPSAYALFKGRIYWIKCYYNNVLRVNMLPCRNASSALGFYDTVTNTFYTANSSMGFTAGGEVV